MFLMSLLVSPAMALTPEQVLKSAWTDKTYLAHQEIQETKSKNPFRSVEAFFSKKENESDESEVGLKFHLKSFPEWSSKRTGAEPSQVLKESSLAWALRDRYAVIVGYEMSGQKLRVLKDLIEVSEKNVQAQTLMMRTVQAGAKSFLSAKEELLRLRKTEALLREEREMMKKSLQRWIPQEFPSDMEGGDLLEMEDVEARIQLQESPSQTLTGRLAKEEIAQWNQELQIVKGRENQWFKSLEVSQTAKKGEHLIELGVSFQLPPLGSDEGAKQKQNELILKMALKQRELENSSDQLHLLRFQILNSLELFKLAKSNQVLARKAKSLDPLASIQNRMLHLKEELDLWSQRQAILTLYLNFLVESGGLSKDPHVNHLSRGKKGIL